MEEAASTGSVSDSEEHAGNIDILPWEEDELAKYSPRGEESEEDSRSLTQKKDSWASAFTDIQVEESQAGKLAKSLNSVAIHDLLAQCKALSKSHRKRNQ